MTFDYRLRRAVGETSAVFSIEASRRDEADVLLVERMTRAGYSPVDLLYWRIVSVKEVGRRP